MKPRLRVYSGQSIAQSTYEGATTGRRSSNWHAPSAGPNSALNHNLPSLRNRARGAYRNNPWLNLGLNRGVSNEIGTGIIPRFRAKNEAFREAFRTLFNQFSENCDPAGVLDFYGKQAQGCKARRSAGECFVRRRRRSIKSDLALILCTFAENIDIVLLK